MPYKYALNNLTQEELKALSNRGEKTLRRCDFCEIEVMMRKGQSFCSPACRTAMGRLVRDADALQMRNRISQLERENEELVKEISALNKELKVYLDRETNGTF